MTNLEWLTEAERGLDLKERRDLNMYFLGVLSVMIDESTWRKALNASVESRKHLQAFITKEVTNATQ